MAEYWFKVELPKDIEACVMATNPENARYEVLLALYKLFPRLRDTVGKVK